MRFLSLIAFFALVIQAQAQESAPGSFYVAPSLFYYSGLRTRTSKDDNSYLVYELKAAGRIYPDLYLGLTYQVEDDYSKTSGYSSDSLNNTTTAKRTSMGINVGYIKPTYHFILNYFWDSQLELSTKTSSANSKYKYTGTGYQLDLGYKIPIWGIHFGPQISYKLFTYNRLSTDGGAATSISPKLEDLNFDPSITVFYFF